MDAFVVNYLMNQFFISFLMLAAAFFVVIPKTFEAYLNWKKREKPTDFSITVLLGSTAFLLLLSVYPLFISEVINLIPYFSRGYNRLIAYKLIDNL